MGRIITSVFLILFIFCGCKEKSIPSSNLHSKYPSYLSGELDIKQLNLDELQEVIQEIANNDKKRKLVQEAARNIGDKELIFYIAQLEKLNKPSKSQKIILEVFYKERDMRIKSAIKELYRVLNPHLDELSIEEKIKSNTEGQTITIPGLDELIKCWWQDLLRDVKVTIKYDVDLEIMYRVFSAITEYKSTNLLTPLEKTLVVGVVLFSIKFPVGVEVVKDVVYKEIKEVLENHYLLPNKYRDLFLHAGFTQKDLENLTIELPFNIDQLKPEEVYILVKKWNREWDIFFSSKKVGNAESLTRQDILNHLESLK